MDHYSELLVRKTAGPRENLLRGLIILLTLGVIALSIFAAIYYDFIVLIIIGIAALYPCYYLLGYTTVEYEYFVTNEDFDVDKILGKRSRKRLVSVKLSSATEWGEYSDSLNPNVNVTVIATDNRTSNIWYVIANQEKIGKVMILFTPENDFLRTMNAVVPYGLRKKFPEPEEETETNENPAE